MGNYYRESHATSSKEYDEYLFEAEEACMRSKE